MRRFFTPSSPRRFPRWPSSITSLVALLLGVALAACSNDQSDQKGENAMLFGLFGGKKAAPSATAVHADVGAALRRESALPAHIPTQASAAYDHCEVAHVKGTPPDAQWVPEPVRGETRQVFKVAAQAGQPALVFLAQGKPLDRLHLWELSGDPVPRFVKERPVALDAAQASWLDDYPVAVSCMPGGRLVVAAAYTAPSVKHSIYVYEPANNRFRHLDRIELDMSNGAPFLAFDTLAASPQAALVLYRTGLVRLAPEVYMHEANHILLFTPQHPDGLEVLKLGIDDGNFRAWAMVGKTLWLETWDIRKRGQPLTHYWSLDLSKVL